MTLRLPSKVQVKGERMGQLIGGKIFVAPNGFDTVRVFRHGYVHPIQVSDFDMIQEMSRLAIEQPEAKGNPFKAFALMGWDEVTDPNEVKLIEEFHATDAASLRIAESEK